MFHKKEIRNKKGRSLNKLPYVLTGCATCDKSYPPTNTDSIQTNNIYMFRFVATILSLYGQVQHNRCYIARFESTDTNPLIDSSQALILGSRNLSGNHNDLYDGLDFIYDRGIEDDFQDDFVLTQRRYNERAAAAFAEDLADLRRKRRDMQDRIFDVIDLNAEIEKARTTLQAAGVAFQRHATKFDNTQEPDEALSKKLAQIGTVPEKVTFKPVKWIKVPDVDIESCMPQPAKVKQNRNNSIVEAAEISDPLNTVALLPLKRRFLRRKKNVSF
ncbi:uncharacterized protein LOC143187558 [Calliopsis andreniformis]|uniref:uncharacterized protein LOC143187558 n=1 Tax=Calliopsis andreniformis TaxID=337506 RepID=UPI003FCE27B5